MKRLFPIDLSKMEWVEFLAEGFADKVCGIIHNDKNPAFCGMPLGGIDTGCIDLETDGTFGYCTIFNSLIPRRGPLNIPFLGISVGNESWILSTQKIKSDQQLTTPGMTLPAGFNMKRAHPVEDIHYWGHYPVADIEYDIDCPVSVGMRAWSPFIPGDAASSNIPGAFFEIHLRNTSDTVQKGRMVFNFPGPSPEETCGNNNFTHIPVKGKFSGVVVNNESGNEYAIGVVGTETYYTGGDLGIDGGKWSNIAKTPLWFLPGLPGLPMETNQAGTSVLVEFELKEKEEKVVRFVLAWYSPRWKGGGTPMSGGNAYFHMYASRYKDALEVARFLADYYESLFKRILAWQNVIYREKKLPVWLRESLVNIFHLITEDGLWAQAKPPIGEWCKKEDGLFGMNESPRGCPQMECIPCSFYGNIPLVYFFPELALSTLRGYKGYQYLDGQMPWVFGGCTCGTPPFEMAMPSRGYEVKPQKTLDGPCYVDMVDRLWLCSGNEAILKEFYESVKKNTIFTMSLRPESGPAGIVSMPSGNIGQDWMENCDLFGIVPHIGGIHLANLKMTERMAEKIGDKEFAQQCREWFSQGSQVLEKETWTGNCYLLYNEPETGKKSDVIMGCQLDGEWMAKFHGLPGVFQKDRVKKTLDTLRKTSVTSRGAIVFTVKKEGEFNPGYWTTSGIHIPGSIMLAMTYMYYGEKDFGMDLAYNTMRALIIENRCSWNSFLLIKGETGEKIYGPDYYQNMMLWALPAAIENQELSQPCKQGGLIERIVQAGKTGRGKVSAP